MDKKVKPISLTELHVVVNEFIEGFHARIVDAELHREKMSQRLMALEKLHGISPDEEKRILDG